jgi:hypothetical protein
VARIENAHGDRNLMCSCPPIDAFDTAATPGGTELPTLPASTDAPAPQKVS